MLVLDQKWSEKRERGTELRDMGDGQYTDAKAHIYQNEDTSE